MLDKWEVVVLFLLLNTVDVGHFDKTMLRVCCLLMVVPPTGSPLQFYVDAVNSGVVTAYGPGLSYGTVNKAATFTVVTKNAGEGEITCFPSDLLDLTSAADR